MNYWLVKQEPDGWGWKEFVKDGKAAWTGVRNYQARNNMRAMKKGDLACFYHSGEEKQIVGLARVVTEAYADPTAEEGDWSCVDLTPVKAVPNFVTLAAIKADKALADMALVRNSRLSVTPVTAGQFERLMVLAGGK